MGERHACPTKFKIFTIWIFTAKENVDQFLLVGNLISNAITITIKIRASLLKKLLSWHLTTFGEKRSYTVGLTRLGSQSQIKFNRISDNSRMGLKINFFTCHSSFPQHVQAIKVLTDFLIGTHKERNR